MALTTHPINSRRRLYLRLNHHIIINKEIPHNGLSFFCELYLYRNPTSKNKHHHHHPHHHHIPAQDISHPHPNTGKHTLNTQRHPQSKTPLPNLSNTTEHKTPKTHTHTHTPQSPTTSHSLPQDISCPTQSHTHPPLDIYPLQTHPVTHFQLYGGEALCFTTSAQDTLRSARCQLPLRARDHRLPKKDKKRDTRCPIMTQMSRFLILFVALGYSELSSSVANQK